MANDRADNNIAKADQSKLIDDWNAAVEITKIAPGSVEKALIFGVNIRVKFPDAFVAGYHMVVAGYSVATAMGADGNWPKAAVDAYRAASSVFSAIIEKVDPLEYVTAVILAQHPDGIDEGKLAEDVNKFLNNPNTASFGWHLGMTAKMVKQAQDNRYAGWIKPTVRNLQSNGFLTQDGTTLRYTQKDVEWKLGI